MIKNQKLRKGDEVKITAGKDKGKTGKIEKVLSKLNKVVVTGINQYKKHVKARTQRERSEIITITKPLHAANVMLVCPKCHLPTRVGFTIEGKDKVRICNKCEKAI